MGNRDRPRFFDQVEHQKKIFFHQIMTSSDLPKIWTTLSKISKFWVSKSFFSGRIFPKTNSMKNIWLGEQLILMKTMIFEVLFYYKCAQFFSALFIILVSLTMTLFSEKVLISNRCISGLMPNVIKKSWTNSNGKCLPLA